MPIFHFPWDIRLELRGAQLSVPFADDRREVLGSNLDVKGERLATCRHRKVTAWLADFGLWLDLNPRPGDNSQKITRSA